MDNILDGLLHSKQDPKVKHAMVQRIRDSGQQGQSVGAIEAMFRTTTRIILKADTQYSVDACKDIFKTWANYNRSTLRNFLDEKFVYYLLTGEFENAHDAVWILHESFTQLQMEYGHTPQVQRLCSTVQTNAVNFVREHPQYLSVAAFCEFLFSFTQCIPQGTATASFCAAVIFSVAGFHASARDTMRYVRAVNTTIGKFLDHLWKHSDDTCTMYCLKTIFDMISFVDKDRQVTPSFALAGIVQYLPTNVIEGVVKRTTEDSSISDENLQTAVMTMVNWLQWPATQNIDQWTIAFLKGLAAAHKYTILMEVVEMTIEKVFSLLEHPVLRNNCFPVLEHMLLGFQHSPEAFHKIVGKVPQLVRGTSQDPVEQRFLSNLSELMFTLMHQYPGFPDLYEPVVEALKDHQRPSQDTMKRRLSQTEWGWQNQRGGSGANSYMPSVSPSRFGRRSETGKAGLVNLGNTCYMNSVIQGLYMCDSFRQELLAASPNHQQPLLQKLQQVFALLTATQRAALSPSDLLKESRPPWFTPGCQQDCSEYLRHLLDQLHEQEMCRLRRELEMKVARGGTVGSSPPEASPKHHRFKFLHGKKPENGDSRGPDLKLESSLIQQNFGGKIVNMYKCLKCKSESSRMESFTDIPLAFPEGKAAGKTLIGGATTRSTASQNSQMNDTNQHVPIALEELVDYYLSPEKLQGDNKYHCDKCKGKQDGERTLQILESPDYLILTLLRFAYNVKTHNRSKIFADVRYPKTLQIPVCAEPASPGTLKKHKNKSKPLMEHYALGAVIVHSGYSSDGGHYYCYARHSVPASPPSPPNGPQGNNVDLLQDKWYMFNDNRVTYSSYESFCNVTQKFAKDTVYVLMYKKMKPENFNGKGIDPNQSVNPEVMDPPLRRDLRDMVDRDNKHFLQEQESQERSRALQRRRSGTATASAKWYDWRDDDNSGPPGSCGGGGMGGFKPRLVF